MASYRVLKSKRIQALVRLKGVNLSQAFDKKSQAKSWASTLEKQIRAICSLPSDEIEALPSDEIEALGGLELFSQLGMDLFEIKNKSQLKKINEFSKKELLQLSPEKIEQLGGLDLFIQAGKRVRYQTFNQVADDYMLQWDKKDKINQGAKVAGWCDVFGGRIMSDIDIFDIREHVALMLESQRPVTVIRKKAVLSSLFKYALSQGYIDHNFVADVVINSDARVRERVLTSDERKALLKACKTSTWDKLHLIVRMAMLTGARRGELLKLNWEDVDLDEGVATLLDTKNGSDRTLSLHKSIIEELQRFQQRKGLIFPSNFNTPKNFQSHWTIAVNKAGINDDRDMETFTFHCLRHGFCSLMSDEGFELSQIGQLAGHRSLQTTMRYIHQDHAAKAKITDKLAAVMGV